MNANAVFLFLGVVAFVFAFLFVLSVEGVILAGTSAALILLIAFVVALVVYLLVTRAGL
jgi:hypothetical protein